MSEQEILLSDIENGLTTGSMAGTIRLGAMADPYRNSAGISLAWAPKYSGISHDSGIYVADFTGLKFRPASSFRKPGSDEFVDHVPVSADHLRSTIDQLLHAAGLHGLCETSRTEREAFQEHIKDLRAQVARLTDMVESLSKRGGEK